MDFRDRLKNAMQAADVNQAQLSEAIGMTRQAINRVLSGATGEMFATPLVKAAAYLGVTAEWLALGLGPMAIGEAGRLSASDELGLPVMATVGVRVLRGYGGGRDERGAVSLSMPRKELDRLLRGYGPAGRLQLQLHIQDGVDMAGAFTDGEWLVVDTGITAYAGFGYYLVDLSGVVCVRGLSAAGDRLQVCCTAPGFPAMFCGHDGKMDGGGSLAVLGRVIRGFAPRIY